MRSSIEKEPSTASALLATRVIEEARGVLKSGIVQAAFAPVKSSKQRKEFYAVLSERALELHDIDKMNKGSNGSGNGKKAKPARHLMDLSVAFNVHNHYDHKFQECVCLMGPDETLLLKTNKPEENAEWYEALMSAVVPSRALRLGRPVMLSEFFEFAWDVDIVAAPSKLKKPLAPEDRLPSMVDKLPGLGTGPRRLCFYPHTIVICKRRIEPALTGLPPSGIPPFKQDQFIEIPRMFAPFFGCLDRYFLVRMGRGSPAGSCELWVQTDSEDVANNIHRKLTMIIERETEKRKKMNGGIVTNTLPVLRSHHRERSHTQPMHMRTNSNGQRMCSPAQSTSMIGRKPSASGPPGSLSSRCSSMSQGSSVHSSPQSRNTSNNSNPIWSVFPPQTRRSSNTASIKEEPCPVYQEMNSSMVPPPIPTRPSPPDSHAGLPSNGTLTGSACSTNTVTAEDTEDSGGTLRLDNSSIREGGAGGSTRSSQRSLIIAEATIERRSKDISSSDNEGSLGGISGMSGTASSTSADPEAEDEAEERDSYAPMDAADWIHGSNSHLIVPNQYERERYNLEEVRSYVSDSSDSCYSSMVANGMATIHRHRENPNFSNGNMPLHPTRAYSFGGHGALKPSMVAVSGDEPGCSVSHRHHHILMDTLGEGLMPPFDDQRKRAFSLGNKSHSFYAVNGVSVIGQGLAQRKTSHGRPQRNSQTSASGMSLASSSGPSSAISANHIACSPSVDDEYPRQRSGSIGSGRSTPYTRRCGGSSVASGSGGGGASGNDHHVEMDFSVLGRTGSGSLASVESPSRSRTSSFGCGVRKEDLFTYPLDLDSIHGGVSGGGALGDMRTPSQKVLEQTRQTSIDDCGDYVVTEVSDAMAQMSLVEQQKQQAGVYLSPTEPFKAMELRQSQVIETIEETACESSRSSSAASLVEPPDDDEYTMMECPASSSSPTTASLSMEKSPSVTSSEVPSTRPDRSASSPVRECLLAPSLPKRSSVPSMRSHETAKDDSTLNYACLQIQDDSSKTSSVPTDSLLSTPSTSSSSARTRSKSGILFSNSPRESSPQQQNIDYTVVRPL